MAPGQRRPSTYRTRDRWPRLWKAHSDLREVPIRGRNRGHSSVDKAEHRRGREDTTAACRSDPAAAPRWPAGPPPARSTASAPVIADAVGACCSPPCRCAVLSPGPRSAWCWNPSRCRRSLPRSPRREARRWPWRSRCCSPGCPSAELLPRGASVLGPDGHHPDAPGRRAGRGGSARPAGGKGRQRGGGREPPGYSGSGGVAERRRCSTRWTRQGRPERRRRLAASGRLEQDCRSRSRAGSRPAWPGASIDGTQPTPKGLAGVEETAPRPAKLRSGRRLGGGAFYDTLLREDGRGGVGEPRRRPAGRCRRRWWRSWSGSTRRMRRSEGGDASRRA